MSAQDRRIRRNCEALAADLPIPVPFRLDAFVAALAARRGRGIELVPVSRRTALPTGILVSTDSTDYIFHASDTSELHQWHIVAHEIGHLVCGHERAVALDQAVASLLMPNLSFDLIRTVLGRTPARDVEEREAELLAYAILRRALRSRSTPTRIDQGGVRTGWLADGLTRLTAALHPSGRPARQ